MWSRSDPCYWFTWRKNNSRNIALVAESDDDTAAEFGGKIQKHHRGWSGQSPPESSSIGTAANRVSDKSLLSKYGKTANHYWRSCLASQNDETPREARTLFSQTTNHESPVVESIQNQSLREKKIHCTVLRYRSMVTTKFRAMVMTLLLTGENNNLLLSRSARWCMTSIAFGCRALGIRK